MVNEEILGGLKLALSKKQSLKQAMMSFYNAGYKREEIKEAARALQIQQQPQKPQQIVPKKNVKKTEPLKLKKQKPIKTIQKVSKPIKPQKVSDYGEETQSSQKIKQGIDSAINQLKKIKVPENKKIIRQKPIKTTQKISKEISQKKVSSYEEKPKPKGNIIAFLLIFFLLFLIGALAAVFFFKQELIDFFSKLFPSS